MSLTGMILRKAAPVPKMESFERFLFIGPHPDDIEIGAGATAAKLRQMGKEVCFLICTDGRFGLQNAPAGTTPEELAGMRKEECLQGASILGVSNVRFLDLKDGGLYTSEELFRGILKVIGEFNPDVVFAPDPLSVSECHPDHLNTGDAAKKAAYIAPYGEITREYGAECADVKALAFYMTAKPNCFVGTKKTMALQRESILCHKSQYTEGAPDFTAIEQYLKIRSVDFGIRSFKGRAEGFRVLGRIHMHCLPEA